MRRLTFGVKSSPFLATRVIQHLAEMHRSSPRASQAILHYFYVDDFISGALSIEEADELHQELISNHLIPRRLTTNSSPVIIQAIHDFSDASTVTYGTAVYLHTMHQDTFVSTTLITPKARVAPLKSTTIPRLELVAAYLLAKLLQYIAKLFDIPRAQIFGWTSSEIILCWLRKAPSSLKTYVSHRVAAIQDIIPPNHWHHVPTKENSADLLNRGMRLNQLVKSSLWWRGPDWLSLQPSQWPRSQASTPRSCLR